jgi:hypothetical protein
MPVTLLRRVVTIFIVTAYLGAAVLQVTPSYAASVGMNHAAMRHAQMSGMMQDKDHPSDETPCKGMLPGCIGDLGCILLVSLPGADLTLVTVTDWSSVSYNNAPEGTSGRTIKPALGPPIPLA